MPFPSSSLAQSGKYTQIQLIGQGAEGNIYRARDNLDRAVAIKEALPNRRGFFDRQERFEKAVRLQAMLIHPNIVAVYHLEQDAPSGELYLICEYIAGGSLADHLATHGPLSEAQAILVTLDLAAALSEIWAKKLVHRDLKPANILLVKDEQGQITTAKLADFGVAKDLDRQRAGQPTTLRNVSHPGTPEYMAPEQADITRQVDVRTDLYALGICLWEMLTGSDYKLVAANHPAALRAIAPQLSPGMIEVIERLVRDNPADRYQTPEVLAAHLRDLQQGRALAVAPTIALKTAYPLRPRRLPTWLLLIAAVALVLLLAMGPFSLYSFFNPPTQATVEGANASVIFDQASIGREAEYPDAFTVGQTIARQNALEGYVHGQFGALSNPPWSAQAGTVSYHGISLPDQGRWNLRLRYAKNSPTQASIQVFLNDETNPRAVIHPLDQGSWDQFVWSDPVGLGTIASGIHTLHLRTSGQDFGVADLDRFELSIQR